ncbi:hypothetical protein D3C86_2064350 [compost metagenome]
MFETKNALDQGGYYAGMAPDVLNDRDFANYDFGDPSEYLLASAIDILAPKTATTSVVSRNRVMSVSTDGVGSKSILGGLNQTKEFIGMIEARTNRK